MTRLLSMIVFVASCTSAIAASPIAWPVRVSANGRYFVDQQGRPVFWLGTTQWELFRGYKLEDARMILDKSKDKGFVFVQTMLVGVGDGTRTNVSGQKPWLNDDPLTPNEAYFRNVDAVIQAARERDLILYVMPYHQPDDSDPTNEETMNRLNRCSSFCQLLVMGVAGWNLAGSVLLGQGHPSLQEGATVPLGEGTATIRRMDALPYVESEFTRRFRFDSFDNPKLEELRERYQLDAVVAPGRDEFERQVLLLDWVHHRFKKFGRPSSEAKGALEILQAIDEGHTFFCSHYAHVFVSAAASLGWIDRELALRRHQDSSQGGSTEHSPTEIWSNQYRKWVMMDPTAHLYIEKEGTPLNAYEIRQEWFYREGRDLVFVVGQERKKYRKSDLPIFLGRFDGFGDLTVPADELDKYGFIGYIPNTDLMDAGLDYGQMFIVKDKLCEGTRWHQRTAPPNPAVDPYFPINQAALKLIPEPDQLRVVLQTLTPNFRAYEARMDGGLWRSVGETFLWSLHQGSNCLEVRTVNQFGVEGPISVVEVEQRN